MMVLAIGQTIAAHQDHVSKDIRDIHCAWCAYSAELDGDKQFLKKVPRQTMAILPSIRQIAEGKRG